MYPTHTDSIGCIMLAQWPHKYKVGHIDLILIKHHISQIHLKNLNFSMCLIYIYIYIYMCVCVCVLYINSKLMCCFPSDLHIWF